jgi:hypothetical protein
LWTAVHSLNLIRLFKPFRSCKLWTLNSFLKRKFKLNYTKLALSISTSSKWEISPQATSYSLLFCISLIKRGWSQLWTLTKTLFSTFWFEFKALTTMFPITIRRMLLTWHKLFSPMLTLVASGICAKWVITKCLAILLLEWFMITNIQVLTMLTLSIPKINWHYYTTVR